MRYVIRIWGADYRRDPIHKLGYMTEDSCVIDEFGRRVAVFENEADAWTFLIASGHMGRDEELGEWAWVEEMK